MFVDVIIPHGFGGQRFGGQAHPGKKHKTKHNKTQNHRVNTTHAKTHTKSTHTPVAQQPEKEPTLRRLFQARRPLFSLFAILGGPAGPTCRPEGLPGRMLEYLVFIMLFTFC